MTLRRATIAAALILAALLPAAGPASAAPTVVTLTQTLSVQSFDLVQNTHFIWNGPADAPVIRLKGTQFATLEHLVIEVPDGLHATAAIEFDTDPVLGAPFGNHVHDVRLGKFYLPGNYDYGLRWKAGTGNTVTNVTSHGAIVANVSIADAAATGNAFRGLYMIIAPVNFESGAAGTTVCHNCGFIGATNVDVKLTDGAGMLLTGMYSEQSRAFADVTAGPAGGGLTVLGGYWMWTPKSQGTTILGHNTGGHRTWIRITDFLLTPIDSTTHGSVNGFAPSEKFFSNVQGLGDEVGNTGAGATVPQFIDFIYPIGKPGGNPPDTAITNAATATATFDFTGTDDRHVREDLYFDCSLDGSPPARCKSPMSYANLSSGQHVFSVRAVDRAGNVDPTPAEHAWTKP